MKSFRVVLTTILGFIFGWVCYFLSKSGGPLNASLMWSIIFSRTLLGFVIGISSLRMNYLLHGIILGIIVSFPMALASAIMSASVFWGTLIAGAVYGFLIELITNLVIKEKPAVAPSA